MAVFLALFVTAECVSCVTRCVKLINFIYSIMFKADVYDATFFSTLVFFYFRNIYIKKKTATISILYTSKQWHIDIMIWCMLCLVTQKKSHKGVPYFEKLLRFSHNNIFNFLLSQTTRQSF